MLKTDRIGGRPSRGSEGYTLTEMLVVLGIIGLLAAVITPTLIGQLGRARVKAATMQVTNVAAQVELFMADTGRYPTATEGLSVLVTEPAEAAEGWVGPYIRDPKALNDPWGRALVYSVDPEGPPTVLSLGADGKPGGSGANRDLKAQAG